MKIRSLIALFGMLFFISGTSLFAQEDTDFNFNHVFGSPVAGPSPTASALAKLVNVPVGYYTGTPAIAVPLYTLQGKHLSLPLSLSYHAGGIKVDELAGNVGLGWSLSAGGAVTRTVKGIADEKLRGYLNFQMSDPPTQEQLESATQLGFDTEPDVFYFNFAGHSGKFVLDKNGEAVLIPYQDVKIVTNPSMSYWEITTPDGIIYTFDEIERTLTENRLSEVPVTQTPSSWYLTKIKHPVFDEEITLDYEETYSSHYISGYDEVHFVQPHSSETCVCTDYYNGNLLGNSFSIFEQSTLGKYVSKITTATGSIEIDYNQNREDINGDKSIDRITVIGADGSTPLRYFTFDYDYFTSTNDNSIPAIVSPFIIQDNLKRLKLLSVTTHAGDDSLPPETYSFQYNEGGDYDLPPRLSASKDHWGFANKNDTRTLIPKKANSVNGSLLNQADRSPNEHLSLAAVLNKITYPTGGSRSFVYEPHSYGGTSYVGNSTCIEDYVNNEPIYIDGILGQLVRIPFSVSSDQYINFIYELFMEAFEGDLLGFITITRVDENGNDVDVFSFGPTDVNGHDEILLQLEQGEYHVNIRVWEGETANIRFDILSLICDPNEPSGSNNVMAGGARIKQIINNDGLKDEVFSFEYPLLENPTKSSGILIKPPRYTSIYSAYVTSGCIANPTPPISYSLPCSYPQISSTSKSPLGITQGSHVGYVNTVVYRGTPANNEGYTEYTYSFYPDDGNPAFPFGDITSMDWARGHLKIQKDFTSAGINVREIEKFYDFRAAEEINNNTVTGYRVANIYSPTIFPTENIIYKQYEHISRWFYLEKSTEILDGVTKEINYQYDPQGITTQPASISVINSDGAEHKLRYTYGSEEVCLAEKYMIHVPIQTEKLVGGSVVGGSRTEFTDCLATEFYEILEGGGELLRGTISDYTPDGYPEDYTKMGFATESYGWQDGLMITRDFIDWHWEYSYDDNSRQVVTTTNIDGQKSAFAYDGFQRLNKIGLRPMNTNVLSPLTIENFNILTSHEYSPINITSTTEYFDAPTQVIVKDFDGLGRTIQTSHNGVLKDQKFYNEYGQVWKQLYLPVESSFTLFEYDGSPLNRVVKTIFPDNNFTQTQYSSEGNYYKVTTTDEKGNNTAVNTEIIGRQAKIIDALLGETTFEYYNHGAIKTIAPPAGGSYTYTYDGRKRLNSKTVPGSGPMEYCYDDATDLLYASLDANLNRISMDYDAYGRELNVYLEEGYSGDCSDALPGTMNKIIGNRYDGLGIQDSGPIYIGKLSKTTKGMLGAAGVETGVISKFKLDDYGRMVNQEDNITIDGTSFEGIQGYKLNHADWVTSSDFSVDAGGVVGGGYTIENIYDDFGRVIQNAAAGLVTKMKYNDNNQMVYKRYDNLDRQDYAYNIRGWLTDINTLRTEVIQDGRHVPVCGSLTGEDETYVTHSSVPPSEFFNLLCAGYEVTLPEVDTCIVPGPPEIICNKKLSDYTIMIPIDPKALPLGPCQGIREFLNVNIYAILGIDGVVSLSNYIFLAEDFSGDISDSQVALDLETDITTFLNNAQFQFTDILFNNDDDNFHITIKATDYVFSSFSANVEVLCIDNETDELIEKQVYAMHDVSFDVTNQILLTIPCKGEGEGSTPEEFETEASNTNSQNLVFPATLNEVILENGQKIWAFDHELSAIMGKYEIYEQVNIKNEDAKFSVLDTANQLHQTTLDSLLILRKDEIGLYDIDVDNEEEENCVPVPPGCDQAAEDNQQQSLDVICAQTLELFATGQITYPYNIAVVQLCNGDITYVLSDLTSGILEGYNILNEFTIESEEDLLDVDIHIEESSFAMKFGYEPNGNIEQMKWKISNRPTAIYDMTYDPLNRVTSASYWEEYFLESVINTSGTPYISRELIQDQNARYSTGYVYDGIGSIKDIWRNGMNGACGQGGKIDDLTLTYGGTGLVQLMTVTDVADPDFRPLGFKPHLSENHGDLNYQYDDNGNMTLDPHKNLVFGYNHLNLPKLVTKPNNDEVLRTWYDATGKKWKKTSTITADNDEGVSESTTTSTVYIYGIEFEGENGSVSKTTSINASADGRVVYLYTGEYGETPAGQRLEYYHTDHLGNVRLCFSDLNGDNSITVGEIGAPDNEIVMEKNYYPFGMEQIGPWFSTVAPNNKYNYNGKEFEEGIGLYDYGARYYDPAISRWTSVDPLAEDYTPYSPYNYVLGNPIQLIDPDGMQVAGEFERDGKGGWVKTSEKGDDIGVDFYHDDILDIDGNLHQITWITDRKGNWNSMNKGRYNLKGEPRGKDIGWDDLYKEYRSGTGPEHNLFMGEGENSLQIKEAEAFNENLGLFKYSGADRTSVRERMTILNLPGSDSYPNMLMIFLGSYNLSFYKLGGRTLALLQNTTSRTSGNFHLLKSYSRSQGVPKYQSGSLQPGGAYGLFNTPIISAGRTKESTSTFQSFIFFAE